MRERVQALVREGVGYEEIGRRLGIRPGLAYLVATGLSADGSDAPSAQAHERPGFLGSSQHLANPQPAENPPAKDSVITWIKRRVAADRQMQEAAAARDAEPGEIDEGDETADIVDVLTRDHNQVKALLEQLSAMPGKRKGGSAAQMSARKSIVDMVTVKLSQHEATEEQYLWPTVRRVLPDGDERADTALQQEQEGKDVLTRLGRLGGDDDEFDELVEKLTLAARTHVAFEERVFLDLRARMPQEEREQLAEKFRSREGENAPTSPRRPAKRKGKPASATREGTGKDALTPEDAPSAQQLEEQQEKES
ncbi:MAG: hemerythrin domain-containing protein [Nocardioidaceae bacterium]